MVSTFTAPMNETCIENSGRWLRRGILWYILLLLARWQKALPPFKVKFTLHQVELNWQLIMQWFLSRENPKCLWCNCSTKQKHGVYERCYCSSRASKGTEHEARSRYLTKALFGWYIRMSSLMIMIYVHKRNWRRCRTKLNKPNNADRRIGRAWGVCRARVHACTRVRADRDLIGLEYYWAFDMWIKSEDWEARLSHILLHIYNILARYVTFHVRDGSPSHTSIFTWPIKPINK